MSDIKQFKKFFNFQRNYFFLGAMLLGFLLYMIGDQLYWWKNREDYSFGFLVPFFAIYAIYDRWSIISSYIFSKNSLVSTKAKYSSPKSESNAKYESFSKWLEYLALVGFIIGLLLFGVGALLRSVTGPQNPASLAIAVSFASITLFGIFIISKERVDGEPMPLKDRIALTCLFLFPALIWLLSAPLVSTLETQIRVFLLTKVTVIVFTVFDLLGYELEREGNVLLLPTGQVGVEEACSGIRSLTACLFAGSFLAAIFLKHVWQKVLLVLAAMLLAVFTNLLRSMFLTLWAYHNGSQAIDAHWYLPVIGDIGSVHDVTGLGILVLTCLGLLLLLPIFNFTLPKFEEDNDSIDSEIKST